MTSRLPHEKAATFGSFGIALGSSGGPTRYWLRGGIGYNPVCHGGIGQSQFTTSCRAGGAVAAPVAHDGGAGGGRQSGSRGRMCRPLRRPLWPLGGRFRQARRAGADLREGLLGENL